jgi:hypothetical protein
MMVPTSIMIVARQMKIRRMEKPARIAFEVSDGELKRYIKTATHSRENRMRKSWYVPRRLTDLLWDVFFIEVSLYTFLIRQNSSINMLTLWV